MAKNHNDDDDIRLIEDYIPIAAISAESRREKSIRKGHISTLHLWWARRPLVSARAAVYGALVPAPADKDAAKAVDKFVAELCKYPGSRRVIAQAQAHILQAHAARLSAERGETVTVADIEAGRAPRPRVLDMFAGGGAIPLEALRLGCEAHAVDLNPVAHLIELCTLVYPQQYGRPDPAAAGCAEDGTWAGLAAEVEHWGQWVLAQVKAEIGELYPPIPDPRFNTASQKRGDAEGQQLALDMPVKETPEGYDAKAGMLTPVAYLWTRTVRCKNPTCGATVPLARQTWLCKKRAGKTVPGRYVALRPDTETNRDKPPGEKTVRYEVVEAETRKGLGFNPATISGSKRGNVPCPFCGTVADSTYVKGEGQADRIGTQPLAVICIQPGETGKIYLGVEDAPKSTWPEDEKMEKYIHKLPKETTIDSARPLTIPDELIITDSKGSAWVIQYGLTSFGQLFTPRQLVSLLTFAKYTRKAYEKALEFKYSYTMAKVIATYLGLMVSRLSDFCSSLCVLNSTGGRGVVHTFGRQALPMVWDFAETNPFNEIGADWLACVKAAKAVIEKSPIGVPAIVQRESSTSLSHQTSLFDAVVTDPPYYDNVAYADLSDFFYVWLKRSVGFLYPEHFSAQLAPKKREAVADATRHNNDRELAARVYEKMMRNAFSEAGRVLKSRAPLVIVYAHKTTLGWSTLVDALRDAGFTVTEAWPLDTERSSRIRAMNTASLASSIFLVARRREGDEAGSYENEVQPDLARIVRERVDRLWVQGVTGADLVIACVGAGLRAFTRYARVEYANGEQVPADTFLAEVEGVVLETLLEKLFGVDRAGISSVDRITRFYVLWRYAYRHSAVDAGEAIVFAYPQRVELDGPGGLTSGTAPLVEKQRSKYHLRDFTERGEDEDLGKAQAGRPAPLIDVLHRLLWLVEHAPHQIPAYLDAVQPDVERLRIVAQTLAGQTLAGNGSGGGRALVAATGPEAAALRKLTTNWRMLIEAHRGTLL